MTSVAQRLDAAKEEQARRSLLRCCGSRSWVESLLRLRPFGDDARLFKAAEEVWNHLSPEDWLEAFSHHPRIGERNLDQKSGGSDSEDGASADTHQWAAQEQAGATGTSAQVERALDEGNRAYEERFGHVFLICATGLSAETMLLSLRHRLCNDPEQELSIAAAEQAKITRLRLQKWADEA